MKIHVLPAGPIQTNAYLLTEPNTGEAVLIDAPAGIWEKIQPVLAQEKCRLTELWLTHGHWDHTQDAARVKREAGAKVRAHKDDRQLIEEPAVMKRFIIGDLKLDPVKIDEFVEQGQTIGVLGRTFEVRHVPGHCPGNVLFYCGAAKFAIVGDALFHGSIGRTDLPGGDFDELARSIREQIYTLPDDTVVLPGHGPRTSVGGEKTGNPFVPAAG